MKFFLIFVNILAVLAIANSQSTTQPCGTFVKYDTCNAASEPSTKGFKGGFYYKTNTTQYVGYGNFPSYCTHENPAPGGIQQGPNGTGAYISCNDVPFTDTKTAYYLLNHPSLKWAPTDNTKAANVTGAVKIKGPNYTFLFGRAIVNGAYRLGKVHASSGVLFIETAKGEVPIFSNFEVVYCEVPCGTFTKYDTVNNPTAPTTKGVLGGYYYKNSVPQYVGYGSFPAYAANESPAPGGIQQGPNGTGAYITAFDRPHVDTVSAFYLNNHPNLKWVAANSTTVTAKTIPGVISIAGPNYTFNFGRVLVNGKYQLGKVHVVNGYLFIETATNERFFNNGYEVITCR